MNESRSREDCLYSICRFPLIYSESGLMPKKIVKLCGYKSYREKISIGDIVAELDKAPHLIEAWLQYIEDKRWTPAWGIMRGSDSFVLFYMFCNGQPEIRQLFSSGAEACARLIRMEMEGLI